MAALIWNSSTIVQELQQHCQASPEDNGCAFHYCSLDNAASQRPVNVFGSILAQAAEAKPELVDMIKPFRKPSTSLVAQNTMTIQEVTMLLKSAISLFDRFSVLIDALNETPHQRLVLSTLRQLCVDCPSLRVLVTCTSAPLCDKEITPSILFREMNLADVNADICAYVSSRLDTESNYRGLSKELRSEVEETMSCGANGM